MVRGLTTAASVWAVAAVGLAAGGGLFFAAGLSTAIVLAILVGVKPLEEAYRARVQSCTLEVDHERDAVTVDDLKRILGVRGGQIRRVTVVPAAGDLEHTSVALTRVSRRDIDAGAETLKDAPGVHAVEVVKARRG